MSEKNIFGSASGKAKSGELRRKCVEYLAHYSLSKVHTKCTVTYDKDTATITICEDNNTDTATMVEENGYTNVSFSGTGMNDWYRALNRAGYRTFVGGHELLSRPNDYTEEIWHYLNPPFHTHGRDDSTSGSSESTPPSTGTITFLGGNTTCDFNIVVNYQTSAR